MTSPMNDPRPTIAELALMLRAAEVRADTAEKERDALREAEVVFFNVTSTAPGSPTGTWPKDTPMPPPSVHAMGSPEAVEGIRAFIANARSVEVENARLRAALTAIVDYTREHWQQACTPIDNGLLDGARVALGEQPQPERNPS